MFPTLAEATQKHPVAPIPASAPSMVATQQMTAAFH
jgi:RND superfamily putative drug exporter